MTHSIAIEKLAHKQGRALGQEEHGRESENQSDDDDCDDGSCAVAPLRCVFVSANSVFGGGPQTVRWRSGFLITKTGSMFEPVVM